MAVTLSRPLSERILGRTILDNIKHPVTGEILAKANEIVDEVTADNMEKADIDEVRVRSVLTCETKNGCLR